MCLPAVIFKWRRERDTTRRPRALPHLTRFALHWGQKSRNPQPLTPSVPKHPPEKHFHCLLCLVHPLDGGTLGSYKGGSFS